MDSINQIIDATIEKLDPTNVLPEEVKQNMRSQIVGQIDQMIFVKCSGYMNEDQVTEFTTLALSEPTPQQKLQLLKSYLPNEFDNIVVESVKEVIDEYSK